MRARAAGAGWSTGGRVGVMATVVVLVVTGASLAAGTVRAPLERTALIAIGQGGWIAGRNWSLLGPVWHSYLVGAYGSVWQVRDHAVYQITVHRYLNILPDRISVPRLVARDWPATVPSAAH